MDLGDQHYEVGSRGKRDVAVGLTTSLIALFVPVFLVVWLVRNIEWGW